MKLDAVLKSSWEAAIGSRKYVPGRQVIVGVVFESINVR